MYYLGNHWKNLIDFCLESLFRLGMLCTHLSRVTLRIIETNPLYLVYKNLPRQKFIKFFRWYFGKSMISYIHSDFIWPLVCTPCFQKGVLYHLFVQRTGNLRRFWMIPHWLSELAPWSFQVNLEAFRTFRGPLFRKQISGRELLFGSTVHTTGSSHMLENRDYSPNNHSKNNRINN